jgi:hypothetical protein
LSKYTVDRFEGELAVLLLKNNESVKKDVPKEFFPSNVQKGDIVRESYKDGRLHYEIQVEETKARRQEAQELLNRLKDKS